MTSTTAPLTTTDGDTVSTLIAAAVAAVDFGTPTARKAGRNPRFPYVPVIAYVDSTGAPRTKQLLARAFTSRDEAVACAATHIDRARAALAADLADPRKRALRQHHGLPRDLI